MYPFYLVQDGNTAILFRCYSQIFELIYILIHSFSQKLDRKVLLQDQKNLERIQKIIDYVKCHYTETISVGEIAGEVGLNEIYFSRFFKTNVLPARHETNRLMLKVSIDLFVRLFSY